MTVLTINGLNIPMSSLQKPSQSSTGNILPSPGQSTPRPSTPYPSVILLPTSDLCVEAPHSKGGVMSGEPPSDAPLRLAPVHIPPTSTTPAGIPPVTRLVTSVADSDPPYHSDHRSHVPAQFYIYTHSLAWESSEFLLFRFPSLGALYFLVFYSTIYISLRIPLASASSLSEVALTAEETL